MQPLCCVVLATTTTRRSSYPRNVNRILYYCIRHCIVPDTAWYRTVHCSTRTPHHSPTVARVLYSSWRREQVILRRWSTNAAVDKQAWNLNCKSGSSMQKLAYCMSWNLEHLKSVNCRNKSHDRKNTVHTQWIDSVDCARRSPLQHSHSFAEEERVPAP